MRRLSTVALSMSMSMFALAIAGCSMDPAGSRLGAGQGAIAFTDRKDAEECVAIYLPDMDIRTFARILSPGFDPHSIPQLHAGNRLVVLEDPGDQWDNSRRVWVRVKTGELAGRRGSMVRRDIRPR